MFDLEKAITEWRGRMLSAGVKTPATLEELELHLREEIERQVRRGLSEQTAFEFAAGEIGVVEDLTREFQMANGPARTLRQWRFVAIAFVLVFGFYAAAMSRILLINDLTNPERWSGFASVATLLLSVAVIVRMPARFFPTITSRTAQSVFGLAGGVSGMSWFLAFVYFILPRLNLTWNELLLAVCWAIVPTLAMPVMTFLILDKNEERPCEVTES